MQNININNLFPNNKNNYKPLDIQSLYDQLNKKIKKVDFSIQDIINTKEQERKKTMNEYKKYFHKCLIKIKTAHKLKKEDMIYIVPDRIIYCQEYNSIDCLNYIQSHLRKIYMDTFILSRKSIFITWINLEKNKSK